MWAWTALEDFWQDIRYAVRALRRTPGFTAVGLLSLALGIGANTAIFSLVNTLILRPLPVCEPRRLVEFLVEYPGDPPLNVFSWQSYDYFRDRNHVFSGLTGVHPSRFSVRGEGLEPEPVDGEAVPGNFFSMLGVHPALGRLMGPRDSAVAVVNWSYWKNKFNLDPAILGRRIVVDDVPVTVAGVAPREFFGVQVGFQPDIWMPVEPAGQAAQPVLQLIARLRPGVSIQQARAEMAVLFRFTLEERTRASKDPVMRQLKFRVEPRGRRSGHGPAESVRETAVGADGRGRPAIANRMHQPGEHAAGARDLPPARNGGARGAGRQPVPPAALCPDRISAAVRRGRTAGCLLRIFRRRRAGADCHIRALRRSGASH